MYEAFYGLRERPFNLTPDPKYLYLSEKHKEAFAHLLFGINNRNGFVMITGEIGTGKTTLCRNLLNQLDSGTEVAFIFNPFLNVVELMKKINHEFGIQSQGDNVLDLTEDLNVHLLNSAAHGKNCVLVIDEAQNLSVDVLEQIRLLSNLETDSEKLLQIILIGQPELAEKLQLRELRQLNQRITARYHLKPLNALETLQYIAYRIHVAGGQKSITFTKKAVRSVYKFSGGVPRMINAICDRMLLIGFAEEQHVMTPALAKKAIREIRGEKVRAPIDWRARLRRWLPAPSVVALVVLAMVLMHYLVDPVDRFARELRLFNTILTEDVDSPPLSGQESTSPMANAAVKEEEETVQNRLGIGSPLLLVIDRLNRSGIERTEPALGPILSELNAQESLRVGIDALITLWNRNLVPSYPELETPESLAAFFKSQGMECETLTLGISHVCALNLPSLARLRVDGKTYWIGVVRADDATITLTAKGSKRVTVSHNEFEKYFVREVIVPWIDPKPNAPVLSLGQRGSDVSELKEQLRFLGLLKHTNTSDIYDRDTEEAIRRVQKSAGLNADGKAGRQVRLALCSLEVSSPALRRGSGLTAMKNTESYSYQKPSTAKKEVPQEVSLAKSATLPKTEIPLDVQKIKPVTPDKPNAPVEVPERVEISAPPIFEPKMPEARAAAAIVGSIESSTDGSVASVQRLLRYSNYEADSVQVSHSRIDKQDNMILYESPAQGLMEIKDLNPPDEDLPANTSKRTPITVPTPILGSVPLVPYEKPDETSGVTADTKPVRSGRKRL